MMKMIKFGKEEIQERRKLLESLDEVNFGSKHENGKFTAWFGHKDASFL